MALCRFCKRKFQSEQVVKSHLKDCSRFNASKNQQSSTIRERA